MALSLATGVRGKDKSPAPTEELPAAAVGGWAPTTFDCKFWSPVYVDGEWEQTPEAARFDTPSVFIPEKSGKTPEAAQATMQKVLAGTFLLWGRRMNGLMPASPLYPANDARALSPMSFVTRPDLPPMLLLVGSSDKVVPCTQQLMFAAKARAAGHKPSVLIFEGAEHGGGGANCEAGREAVLQFLRSISFKLDEPPQGVDPAEYQKTLAHAIDPSVLGEYENLGTRMTELLSGRSDVRLSKL